MPLLLNCRAVSKTFGSRTIFENISLTLDEDERLGLIGPNGAGKSTFLLALAGRMDVDEGEVVLRRNVRLGYVPQQPEFPAGLTVQQVLEQAAASVPGEDYERVARISQALGRVGFTNGEARTESLSGGWRKRLAIACELVREPDILLLDEPTNHLDLQGIEWLEELLRTAPFASVTVSHDRYFLDNVVTRMAEIDRTYPDGLLTVPGDYTRFVERKDEFMTAQSRQEEALSILVRREIEWLRRRPKARTTKSKARIDNAGRLMEELSDVASRNQRGGSAGIDFVATERKTKRLVTAENLTKTLGGKPLFDKLSFTLMPGTRLGIVGPNGSGKSTLLRVLVGQLPPDAGTVETADGLRVVYFDQNREQLDPQQTLRRALTDGSDTVIYRDRPMHIVSWASRFLFRKEQLDLPVSRLSGGEQARVLMARLMLQPADVLLMDEPTNDLDIPTLEVLEESLTDFPGALLLITHDRYLLDRVATSVVGLDGCGGAGKFADYRQWEQWVEEREEAAVAKAAPKPAAGGATASGKKKLSFTENREYEQIEARIHAAEEALAAAQAELEEVNRNYDPQRLQSALAGVETTQAEVDRLYGRWAELEARLA